MEHEPSPAEWLAIFEKSERDVELRKLLAKEFDDYGYLLTLREYLGYLRTGQRRLSEIVAALAANVSTQALVQTIEEVRLLYFSLFSVQQAVEDYLYEGAKSLRCADALPPIIDQWKHRPLVRLTKALRNRVQHGAFAGGTVHVEVRSVHHAKGKGAKVVLDPDPEIWAKLIKDLTADAKPQAKAFLEELVPETSDRFVLLSARYLETLVALDDRIEDLFKVSYAAEYEQKEQRLAELQEVSDWLEGKGVGSASIPQSLL